MYRYSIDRYIEVNDVYVVIDRFLKKTVYKNTASNCIKYIKSNNEYQLTYSKLFLKKINTDWVTEIRTYNLEKSLNDFDLCDIPNLRKNAKFLN